MYLGSARKFVSRGEGNRKGDGHTGSGAMVITARAVARSGFFWG